MDPTPNQHIIVTRKLITYSNYNSASLKVPGLALKPSSEGCPLTTDPSRNTSHTPHSDTYHRHFFLRLFSVRSKLKAPAVNVA